MDKDQRITELQRKIELIETEKQGIQNQLNKIKSVFLGFKTQYDSVMTEMDTRLSSLSVTLQTLRNELSILETANEPTPQKEQVKADSVVEEFDINPYQQKNENVPVSAAVQNDTIVEETKIAAAEVKQEVEKSEIVKENVVSEVVVETHGRVSNEEIQSSTSQAQHLRIDTYAGGIRADDTHHRRNGLAGMYL